jgi:hypothetical protein
MLVSFCSTLEVEARCVRVRIVVGWSVANKVFDDRVLAPYPCKSC